MKNNINNNQEARIMRLFELIKDTERTIEISKEWESPSMVKQHIHLKNKLVKELLELLNEELKIEAMLKNAA